MRTELIVVGVVMLTIGCMKGPSTTVSPRQATQVSAPQSRTWDAVVDVFADRNISIRTMDRSSGFIATDELGVREGDGLDWADCGTNLNMAIGPTRAVYNVLVRGDGTTSTVKATVRWTTIRKTTFIECTSKGTWETQAESEIKRRAEGLPATAPPGQSARLEDQPDATKLAVPPGTKWIADKRSHTYYPADCAAASHIAPADQLYYGSESSLLSAGFTRSKDC